MAKDRIQAGLRLESEALYKISAIAKHNKRSLNAQLEYLVQECIALFEKEHGPIKLEDE